MKRAWLVVALAACTHASSTAPVELGGDRPVMLHVPAGFDPSKQYPLYVVLHGYGATGLLESAYLGTNELATDGDAFVLAPDGNIDSTNKQFWNADPACCDFDHSNPDDVGYLGSLIDQVSAAWPIDPQARVLIGHSNGGYMAYRMACDRADVVSNIVVLAGAAASAPTTCVPQRAVEVLHLHGTDDTEVPYDPNAMASVAQWAQHDGCAATFTAGPDQPSFVMDMATHTQAADGCPSDITIELWTIDGGSHIPNFNAFAPTIRDYVVAHRRPK